VLREADISYGYMVLKISSSRAGSRIKGLRLVYDRQYFQFQCNFYKKIIDQKKYIAAGALRIVGPLETYHSMIDSVSFLSCFGVAKYGLFMTGVYMRLSKAISRLIDISCSEFTDM
jgi:hypothetical protein